MKDSTGYPFADLRRLVTGNGEVIAFVCSQEKYGYPCARGLHYQYGCNVCDFCVIHGGEWRYFYRTLDSSIPMKYSEIIERWLLTRISEDSLFPLNECDYFDSLLVNSLN
jgi:hypothetical protein